MDKRLPDYVEELKNIESGSNWIVYIYVLYCSVTHSSVQTNKLTALCVCQHSKVAFFNELDMLNSELQLCSFCGSGENKTGGRPVNECPSFWKVSFIGQLWSQHFFMGSECSAGTQDGGNRDVHAPKYEWGGGMTLERRGLQTISSWRSSEWQILRTRGGNTDYSGMAMW